MLVAKIGEHQLRAEVEVAPTVGINQVAPRAGDEGRDGPWPLRHPGMKYEFVEIHDILHASGPPARGSYSCGSRLHGRQDIPGNLGFALATGSPRDERDRNEQTECQPQDHLL